MGQHTSGSWRATHGTNNVIAADGKTLAHDVGPYSRGGGAPHDERAANARLIAAAPDLLEAAREAVYAASFPEDEDGYIDRVRLRLDELAAAIAKAEGR